MEDADELVEEVEHLVDGVEGAEISNILLPLRVHSNTSQDDRGRVLVLVSLAIPLSSQHSLKYAKECR